MTLRASGEWVFFAPTISLKWGWLDQGGLFLCSLTAAVFLLSRIQKGSAFSELRKGMVGVFILGLLLLGQSIEWSLLILPFAFFISSLSVTGVLLRKDAAGLDRTFGQYRALFVSSFIVLLLVSLQFILKVEFSGTSSFVAKTLQAVTLGFSIIFISFHLLSRGAAELYEVLTPRGRFMHFVAVPGALLSVWTYSLFDLHSDLRLLFCGGLFLFAVGIFILGRPGVASLHLRYLALLSLGFLISTFILETSDLRTLSWFFFFLLAVLSLSRLRPVYYFTAALATGLPFLFSEKIFEQIWLASGDQIIFAILFFGTLLLSLLQLGQLFILQDSDSRDFRALQIGMFILLIFSSLNVFWFGDFSQNLDFHTFLGDRLAASDEIKKEALWVFLFYGVSLALAVFTAQKMRDRIPRWTIPLPERLGTFFSTPKNFLSETRLGKGPIARPGRAERRLEKSRRQLFRWVSATYAALLPNAVVRNTALFAGLCLIVLSLLWTKI